MPIIGDRPITDIEPMEIVGIMRTVEANGTFETRDWISPALVGR